MKKLHNDEKRHILDACHAWLNGGDIDCFMDSEKQRKVNQVWNKYIKPRLGINSRQCQAWNITPTKIAQVERVLERTIERLAVNEL